MRSALIRSTPLRLTVILGATFILALLLAGTIAANLINRELALRSDRAIADTFTVIAQAFGDSDQADLIDSVNSHTRAAVNSERVFALAAPDGSILAGNIARLPGAFAWQTVEAAALGLPSSEMYRVYVGDVEGNRLLVGQSFAQSDEISRIVLWSAGWASALALLLVLAAGIAVAVRAQARIDGIARTMTRVGHGELAARIHVGRRGDDIDLLATQVNSALDRLGGLVEGMRHVSVNIAHDLKTPLNRLAITLEDAAQSATGDAVPLLEQAQGEIRQINATFDALLRIAQIEAGARRARFVPVRLGAILERIAEAYGDVAEESGRSLRVVVDPNLPAIEGDTELLTQLSANLIENSIRHAPRGTQITAAAALLAGDVVATFADNGPGIPEGERGKVFERLYRVDKSRSTPGSGLGLSLVKAIADLHGATIEVGDNRPGLRISIRFPSRAASTFGRTVSSAS